MPHTESLTARLIRLRRDYTGETQSAVVPEIRSGLQGLAIEDRAQLNRAFRASAKHAPLSSRARAAVIPEATSPPQQHLEAAVLKAASRVAFTQSKVFWAVRPRPNELILHVQPEALGLLLRELLPREHDGGLHGVPGLRARIHRRHVELYSLGVDLPASIALAGVAYRRFIDVLDVIDADRADDDPLRWRGQDPQPLRPAELELLHSAPHASVASAVLRRIRLFPAFPEVTTSVDRPEVVALDWFSGPSTARVMISLLHRIAGIPTIRIDTCDVAETHLALAVDQAQLLLRGPDLRAIPTSAKEPTVTSDNTPFTAADLCARIVQHLDGAGVYVYGAGLNDAILVGLEHTTTVLVTRDGRQRWFKVSVEEFFPGQVSVLSLDHDVVVSLARRAGVSRPAFGLGPC